ncbi:MAG: hypothetical protein R3C59_12170 [Planctomycetaceae bacterium]
MTWRKLGRIYDPVRTPSLPNCTEFAQSPQALVFDSFVRIYFCTRERDSRSGKFLSHVSFVDMSPDLRSIIRTAERSVLKPGDTGCFDEHGIFPINVLRVNDRIRGYTTGWSRRVSVSVETSIGLVVSHDDGETFERIGPGPVLTRSLFEPCLVGDGFVQHWNGTFHMWYIFGLPWKQFPDSHQPERIYKIGHVTSSDGIHWSQQSGRQIVSDVLGDDECQALPTVIHRNGRYQMWFCYRYASDFRTNPERGYRLGYAHSDDLITWTRDDREAGIDVSPDADDWDSRMMCYPHAFHCHGLTYLLYNGNEFGRYGFGAAVMDD